MVFHLIKIFQDLKKYQKNFHQIIYILMILNALEQVKTEMIVKNI